MRHRKKGNKLGRSTGHRKQTLAALSGALIEHKRITTTLAKAKALRPFVEPLITRAKEDTMHNRKQVMRHLQDKEAINELFGEVADRVGDRPGGYTRVIKLGQRSGDGAELAMIELVDYNDVKPAGSSSGRSRTRRGSGKGRRRTSKQQEEEAQAQETVVEEPDVEEPEVEPDMEEPAVEEEDVEAAAEEEVKDEEEAEAEATEAEASEEATESEEEEKES